MYNSRHEQNMIIRGDEVGGIYVYVQMTVVAHRYTGERDGDTETLALIEPCGRNLLSDGR